MRKKFSEKRLFIGKLASEQKVSSKRRSHIPPLYTISELWDWVNSPEQLEVFTDIWDRWKASGDRMDMPSIDRLSDELPYSFDNIQIVTWRDNNSKSHAMAREGLTVNSSVRAIDVYNIDLELVDSLQSLQAASSKYDITPGAIHTQCNAASVKKDSVKNYLFRYSGDCPPMFREEDKILQLDMSGSVLNEFDNVKDAMKYLGISNNDPSPLRAAIRGTKRSYKGFKWKKKI